MSRMDWESAYGPPSPALTSLVTGALRQEEKPVKRRHYTAILVMGLILILLAATAVAVTLSRSAEYTAMITADKALEDTYGLTKELLGLFYRDGGQEEGVWTVVYTPFHYKDQTGGYTVTVDADGQAGASWTHDGVDLLALQDEGLDSPVWGAKQLELVHALDVQYEQTFAALLDGRSYYSLTLQEQAELDRIFVEAGHPGEHGYLRVMPGEEDIPETEAYDMAVEAITAKYGVTREYIESLGKMVSFRQMEDGERVYQYTLYMPSDDLNEFTDTFNVLLWSPSGEITQVTRYGPPEQWTLPDGPLDGYEEAVLQFIQSGAFLAQPHEARADISARLKAAGFEETLGFTQFAPPAEAAVGEAQAIESAHQALEDAYGVTDAVRVMFEETVMLLYAKDDITWVVDLTPAFATRHLSYEYSRLGDYRAVVDAQTGEVTRLSWSLTDANDPGPYTEETFGQARAWGKDILPWALELDDALRAINERTVGKPWLYKEEGERHALYRAAGFDADDYPLGLPGEGDLTYEEALAIVRAVLADEFSLTPEGIKALSIVQGSYIVAGSQAGAWRFYLYPEGMVTEDSYYFLIDGKTGEVLMTEYYATGNG